jgi:hypothetical protein
MKYLIIIVLIAGPLIVYGFMRQEVKSTGMIGDIRYSILPPDKFDSINGKGWILLDGRDIKGSDLQIGGNVNEIPDARGMFIRGLNLKRTDGKQDPFDIEHSRERLAGEYEEDAFKAHHHPLSFAPATGQVINTTENNFYNEFVGRKDKIIIKDDGGTETRPKNIALFIYIKINN